jgi:peptidoglycan/xylan/chitin deacetylase (PgdA/CDA1 family)
MLKGIDGTRLQARSGRKMAIVRSPGELQQRFRELNEPGFPNLMLQEYIPGGDDTIWMFNGYFDARSQCLAAFTGKKLRQHPVHTGATSLGLQCSNETVSRITTDFMRAVGYRGILDIGYRFDARDGSYKLLDPNPRIGQTFRLFLDREGWDVARCLYADLTGQPVPALTPREGRKWVVEDKDLESCLDYRREGLLPLSEWRRSYRGVEEGAWFAWDDLGPFARAMTALAGRAAAAAGRRARRVLWDDPRRWWGAAVNRRVQGGLGRAAFAAGVHRRVLRNHAVILCFHRVDDRFPGDFLGTTVAQFRAYCDFLASRFEVVPLSELLGRVERGAPVDGLAVITFDDGYRDNYATVAPELERRGLPATFFISTALIGSTFVPSWDVKCGVATEWMSWDQVRDLRRQGFEIGSHTMHHVDLGRVTGADAERELVCSRERLERELGEPVRLFSYPYGQRDNITEPHRALVRRAGYACCLSAYGGLVTSPSDPFRLERVGVTPWHRSPAHLGFDLLRLGKSAGPPVPA